MKSILSASLRAERFITELITDSVNTGQFVLPSITNMANACGISRMTMYKAVAALKAQGILACSKGRGILVASAVPAIKPPAIDCIQHHDTSAMPRWKSVKYRISENLLDKSHSPGSMLPSRKELMRRYGVSPATLRKALRALEHDGRIVPWAGGYRSPEPLSSSKAGSSLLYLSFHGQPDQLELTTPFSRDMLRALEQFCIMRGVQLQFSSFHDFISQSANPLSFKSDSTILGAFVSNIAPFREQYLQTLELLFAAGLPVAIFNESGDNGEAAQSPDSPLCKRWALGTGPEAGRQVGRFLLNLGHKRIAFLGLAPADLTGWRLAGLKQAFALAGKGATHIYTRCGEMSMQQMEDSHEFDMLRSSVQQATKNYATALRGHTLAPDENKFIIAFGQRHWQARYARELFRRVLDECDATAWVCFNDSLAIMALDFLTEQAIAVPRHISVVGFDNTVESFSRGLTSYNFAPETVMHSAVEHILNPGQRKRGEPAIIELPGMVMARRSCGVR